MDRIDSRPAAKRRLRLKALDLSQLPHHPGLAPTQSERATTNDLQTFVHDILTEGVEFSDSVIPSSFHKRGSPKASGISTAKVQLLECTLVKGETWFGRQSLHENAAVEGSASWDEFEQGLFDNRSVHEMEYTPTVFEAHKVVDWSEQIEAVGEEFGGEFEDVALEIYEMCHQIPGPLQNRVFSTLITRGFTRGGAFIVVQIPVDIRKLPSALYSNGKNVSSATDPQKREKLTIGEYVSIERVKEQDDGKIMWEMVTASDAKGWLPMSVQKMGVPGAIIKDVGFFMKWVADRRKEAPVDVTEPEA